MAAQEEDHHLGHAPDPAEIRRRLAALAAAIAVTEDRVADTLERTALVRPYDAGGLRARAAQARKYATFERNQAASFGRHH